MFILAYIAALIVDKNWADVPSLALWIIGAIAALELITYIIAFAVWGTVVGSIIKEWRKK